MPLASNTLFYYLTCRRAGRQCVFRTTTTPPPTSTMTTSTTAAIAIIRRLRTTLRRVAAVRRWPWLVWIGFRIRRCIRALGNAARFSSSSVPPAEGLVWSRRAPMHAGRVYDAARSLRPSSISPGSLYRLGASKSRETPRPFLPPRS